MPSRDGAVPVRTPILLIWNLVKERAPMVIHWLGSVETWRKILTVISAATTAYGLSLLYDVFGVDHGKGSIGVLRFLIPLGLAGALHALIFSALSRWVHRRRARYLLLAIPLQMLAILASFGTHWTHMRGSGETVESYTAAQDSIVRGIEKFTHSYGSLAEATAALAAHSTDQAKLEEHDGTSCGTAAGHGHWVRYELRIADRDTYARFNAAISEHRKQLEALLARAQATTAASASDAMAQLASLRQVVNEAKAYETDLLVQQLRRSAQERLALGKGPIEIPPGKRKPGGATTFICPDPTLARYLSGVLEAAAALKPIPEVEVEDARNPEVGVSLALQRMWGSLFAVKLYPPNRADLRDARVGALAAKPDQGGLRRGDLPPLAIASTIEALLTLLFWWGGGGVASHPGMAHLEDLLRRQMVPVMPRVWASLGAGMPSRDLLEALDHFIKYEGRSALVIIPIYTIDPTTRSLHRLMELLVRVGLAKRMYTGARFSRFFTAGWIKTRAAATRRAGAIRVYRMDEADYLALITDALHCAPPFSEPREESHRRSARVARLPAVVH